MNKRLPRTMKVLLIAVAILGGLGAWYALTPYFFTHLVWFLRTAAPFVLPLLATAAAAVFLVWLATDRDDEMWLFAAVGVALIGLVGTAAWAMNVNYQQARQYATSVEITNEPAPAFTERGPFQVAQAQSSSGLGDNPGDLVDTTYLAAEDQYTNLVTRRGFTAGYSTVLSQQVPLDGRATDSATCDFAPAASQRLDGWFGGNLGRTINTAPGGRGLSWSSSDAYGYCESGSPVVVVPLVEQVGFWFPVERPAGVAVYDGGTGELEIRHDSQGIPGPVYPQSLAAQQRDSTGSLDGFWSYVWRRAGWNNDNEFNLADRGTRQPLYVTTLKGRGSATAISALSVVDAQAAPAGGYAPVRVHRLPESWVSAVAIEDRIKADYQDIPAWASGLQIMEVAPLDGVRWTATLGREQNVMYRVQGVGTLQGPEPGSVGAQDPARQATCLYEGNELSRCGTRANADGNGAGTPFAPGEDGQQQGRPAVRGLSDDELLRLDREINDEMRRRLGDG